MDDKANEEADYFDEIRPESVLTSCVESGSP